MDFVTPMGCMGFEEVIIAINVALHGPKEAAPVDVFMNERGEVAFNWNGGPFTPKDLNENHRRYARARAMILKALRMGTLTAVREHNGALSRVRTTYWQSGSLGEKTLHDGLFHQDTAGGRVFLQSAECQRWIESIAARAKPAKVDVRKMRTQDPGDEAVRTNKIDAIKAALRSAPRGVIRAGVTAQAKWLLESGKGQNYKLDTLRQIISDRYRPLTRQKAK